MDVVSMRRVLIAKDDPDAAEALSLLLEMEGCATRVCRFSPEVVPAVLEFLPHLVLLDLHFGGPHGGLQIARRLRSEPDAQDVVLVAFTGWARLQDRPIALDAGFHRLYVEPVDRRDIVQLALSIDRRRSTLRAWPAAMDRRKRQTNSSPEHDR